jgi:hypothetical protein
MESNKNDSVVVSAIKCGQQLNIDLQKVFECISSNLGSMLEHNMAGLTDALQPPHQYVPWVTINNVHTEDIEKQAESNLIKLVCDTYKVRPRSFNNAFDLVIEILNFTKGDDKPAACSQI